MTICISVKTAEGLVLAADSASMLIGTVTPPGGNPQVGVLQNYEYANKLSRIKDYPVGVLSWGAGSIGARSIQSLIMEFEHSYKSHTDNAGYKVAEIADDLITFVRPRYDAAYQNAQPSPPVLGLLIGGYSAGAFFPDVFTYVFPSSSACENVRPDMPNGTPNFGANWFGMTDALSRLIHGYDEAGLAELIKRGVDQAVIQKWIDDHVTQLPLIFDSMPLQDAIDFADYAAQVTIGRYRFAVGPPLCGGAVDVAVITPEAFQWARRKQWAVK